MHLELDIWDVFWCRYLVLSFWGRYSGFLVALPTLDPKYSGCIGYPLESVSVGC